MGNLEVEYKNISTLAPYLYNPRINDHAVEAVANSISEFGFKNPIVVDSENEIIAGHTRLKAAEVLGMEYVPVIVADDLDEEQAKAFRLADNKTGEIAEWDFEMLRGELDDISNDLSMDSFGFDDFIEDIDIDEIYEQIEGQDEKITVPMLKWGDRKIEISEDEVLLLDEAYNQFLDSDLESFVEWILET